MLWIHTSKTLMYVRIGMLVGVILGGVTQQMQGPS